MIKFIKISRNALRYAPADVIVNLNLVVSVTSTEERDIPIIVIDVGSKLLQLKFNNTHTRNEYYDFILEKCTPESIAKTLDKEDVLVQPKRRTR